ncbi:hypothetical protein BHM03_00004266 [Ensete ventricosum]|uniref:Uncharacterized protein n=1 Tax=Ensete ventricosum TaxID=4639 RepID=A0A445MAI0_ENSVE|nr:hypothetical protein BHM03_00004266 [Ensete ventricosum]
MRRIHIVAARRRIILVSLLLGVCFQVLYQDVIVAGDVRNAIVERFPGATFSLAPWQEQRKGGGKEIPPLVPKESPPESWYFHLRHRPRGSWEISRLTQNSIMGRERKRRRESMSCGIPAAWDPPCRSTGNRVGPRGEGAGSINHEIDRERESDV